MMVDNSVQVLYSDGMTSTCPVFPSKLAESSATPNKVSKAPTNTDDDDVPVDQDENVVVLQAEWTTVTSDGERFVQNLDGSKTSLEPVKLSVATCPVTDQVRPPAVRPSVCLPVFSTYVCLFLYYLRASDRQAYRLTSVYLSFCLSVCLSVCLPFCTSVFFSLSFAFLLIPF